MYFFKCFALCKMIKKVLLMLCFLLVRLLIYSWSNEHELYQWLQQLQESPQSSYKWLVLAVSWKVNKLPYSSGQKCLGNLTSKPYINEKLIYSAFRCCINLHFEKLTHMTGFVVQGHICDYNAIKHAKLCSHNFWPCCHPKKL